MYAHTGCQAVQPCEQGAAYSSCFRIGGVSVRLSGDDPASVVLTSPLLPFTSESEKAEIDLRVEWVERLCSQADSPSFDSGALWRLYERENIFCFDFVAPVFGQSPYKRLLIDKRFSHATLQVRDAALRRVPETAPLDYPLDELLIMHRLTQERAIELHGAGIVSDGIGRLFVGHSGAGKSTTTRLWIEHERVDVLSDDRIIVRRAPSKSQPMRMYGTPWHGEAHFASPNSVPLAAIFVVEHGQNNILTRLSESHAVAELFARSFVPFHHHRYVESALSFLNELVRSVPVYRYAFEPDQRAIDTILNLHD